MLGTLWNLGAFGLSTVLAIRKTKDYVQGTGKKQIFGRELKLCPEHQHRCKSKHDHGETPKGLAILDQKEDFSHVFQISNLELGSNLNPPNNNE